MSKFIELTNAYSHNKFHINISHIVYVGVDELGFQGIRLSVTEKDKFIITEETPAEIMAKIQEVQNG
ncbi:hypothetical protein NHG29_01745 [Aerococcaceae bacterium NML160702]|nr:hypothetical protein [Aerococcaceae bacterium NML160702]